MEKFKSFSIVEYHSILKFEYPQIQFLLRGNFYFCQRNLHNFSAGNTMICLLCRRDLICGHGSNVDQVITDTA